MKTVKVGPYKILSESLKNIDLNFEGKTVINTINAHSYIVAKKDLKFHESLVESDILLPDGEGIVMMIKKLKGNRIKKIAGAELHDYLLEKANKEKLKCFYLGSSETTLDLLDRKLSRQFQNVVFGFLSPPFKQEFSKKENDIIIDKINAFSPDILFVGMTAPKQEKWVFNNKKRIQSRIICPIGAVFDFVAGTKKRAPKWVIDLRLEWLYRSFTAWRLTKRYLYSTPLFVLEVYRLKYLKNTSAK